MRRKPLDPTDTEYLVLSEFPVLTEIPVLWSDEDAFAHVNNVSYLRWCETARVQYLREIALFPELPPRDIGPILATVTCDYRRQLKYPDTVVLGTRVTSIGNSSFRMEHVVFSRATGEIAAEVDSCIVTVDYSTGRPVRVPDHIREAIARLEQNDSFDPASEEDAAATIGTC
jgi:acyl-CoA thioester hydrolase